jgi:hypothetical protein
MGGLGDFKIYDPVIRAYSIKGLALLFQAPCSLVEAGFAGSSFVRTA